MKSFPIRNARKDSDCPRKITAGERNLQNAFIHNTYYQKGRRLRAIEHTHEVKTVRHENGYVQNSIGRFRQGIPR